MLIRVIVVITLAFIGCLCVYKTLFSTFLLPFEQPSIHLSTLKELHNSGHTEATYFIDGRNYRLEPGETRTISVADRESLAIFSPLDGMTTMLKLCFWTSLVISSPLWLYFVFVFVTPAIEPNARRMIVPFILILFAFGLLGLGFAYSFTIPFANQFLFAFNQELGQNLWGLSQYIDYSILLILSHIFVFELAAVLLLMVHYGVISSQTLASKRRHAYLVIFIIAAVLTPPDVFTQVALGIPMAGFYELIIAYGWMRSRKVNYQEIRL